MNFVDAAIVVLGDSSESLPVDEVCQRVLDRKLLSRPGKNPLRSMKGRLTLELRKGENSRLVLSDDDKWALADDAEKSKTEDLANAELSEKESEETAKPYFADDADDDTGMSGDDDDDDDDDGDDDELSVSNEDEDEDKSETNEADDEGDADEEDAEPEEEEGEPLPPPTPEEAALLAIYGDDLDGTTPVSELTEYRDEKSADEDRAMLPEIKQERKRWGNNRSPKGKRERRGKKREGRSSGSADKTSPLRSLLGMDAGAKIKEKSVRNAEEAVIRAVADLEVKTIRALTDRLAKMSQDDLEPLFAAFLERNDFVNVEWIKRVKKSSYGLAESSRGGRKYLVEIWGEDRQVTRRGIGELRAGVDAKGASAGMLLSAQPLGSEAKEELENAGARIDVHAGARLVKQLAMHGVGVVRTAIPLTLLDVGELPE